MYLLLDVIEVGIFDGVGVEVLVQMVSIYNLLFQKVQPVKVAECNRWDFHPQYLLLVR